MSYSPRELLVASRQDFTVFADRAMQKMMAGYQHFKYLDLVGAYWQAVIDGEDLNRLVINMPPRHGKSLHACTAVAYFLGKYPQKQVLVVSHSDGLVRELSQTTYDLMTSPFYQEIFPGTRIREDRRSVSDFETTAGGGRLGASFGTSITGRGSDLTIIDDPLSANNAQSAAERERVNIDFDGMIVSRLNDRRTGKIVLVTQRLHQDDLTGHVLKKGYRSLVLPFEAEGDERFEFGGVVYEREKGEVLQPARFPLDVIARDKAETPSHLWATQYQQRPTAIGAGMIRREDFYLADAAPSGGEKVISWDTASSERPGSSYSVALAFKIYADIAYLIGIFRQQRDLSETNIGLIDAGVGANKTLMSLDDQRTAAGTNHFTALAKNHFDQFSLLGQFLS